MQPMTDNSFAFPFWGKFLGPWQVRGSVLIGNDVSSTEKRGKNETQFCLLT